MTFQKGQSGNPKGRTSGRQAFIDRARPYLEDFTIDDLVVLASDKERFGKLSVIDGMIVRRLATALSRGGGRDMDAILDRVIGKANPCGGTEESQPTLADLVLAATQVNKAKDKV